MKKLLIIPCLIFMAWQLPSQPAPPAIWSGTGCTSSGCHNGVEPIRQLNTGMMKQILALGKAGGDPDGCAVCHGGDPGTTNKAAAHKGAAAKLASLGGPDEFYADPASPWINARTCGQCHKEQVRSEWASLMMTESGKAQGTAWAFGAMEATATNGPTTPSRTPKIRIRGLALRPIGHTWR